jgi:hypothetical protein
LNEIKTLAASKTLTKAKQETAQKALNTHIEAFQKNQKSPNYGLKMACAAG